MAKFTEDNDCFPKFLLLMPKLKININFIKT